ncbi:ABC transporter substrate-binding protein [Virgibacillus profundi]|uniref:ABC transporter substrate-binding protein n=1 Tax=Virgibacillus profundi TaxID=2024555 RepID=A0A2A2I9P7_9BACI|nr:ABC transporter substrate-binding protein [Virgibacillus profundi]PAV28046.1 ABC transporter substrate-binding protein [Virgibacillus profundi]PXY52350.1 ABC transporter substrate-binding protein [Virgibacillus profundi]
MKKRIGFALLSMLFLAFILAGCGQASSDDSSEANAEGDSENKSVEIGMLKLTSSAPFFIALEKGFFEEEGIDVEVNWFEAAQPISVATAGGDIDVGATGITASLYNMVAGGEELVIVADKGREQEGYSSTALLVPSDSDADSVEDLAGKKIGITQTGSTFHYMAGRLLEEHGLATDDVELVPVNSIPGLMETLESKQVDAVLLNEPNITRVLDEGYGKLITQVGDVIDYQVSGVFFSKTFADDTDTATNFMKAYAKATQYYYDAVLTKENGEVVPGENYDEVVNIIAEYTDQEPELIKQGLPYMDRDGKLLASDIQTQIDWYAKEELIGAPIDAEEIINTELLDNALKELE